MKTESNIVSIDSEMRRSYLDYAMSVIIGRALPDVRDGMKPVHRRVLYAMYDAGNTHNKPYKKSARIVGDVIGKYHPHGDAAVYDTIVRMAQGFSLRYPLVDGQGNFGSVDGDPPAAMRYTEVRMARITEEVLSDIDRETVDFVPNYDESLKEPTVLPTRIPLLLVNGSSGIAVGMATNIPPHNLGEIVDATIQLIDNQGLRLRDIMNTVPGPDFPTGGIAFAGDDLVKAYETGKGSIVLRGKVKLEEEKSKRALVITEIPYAVNKAALIERIASLVHDKRIDGISDIRDESDKEGLRVVIELKRDANEDIIKNKLYTLTNLQTTFYINMLAIHNGRPRRMGLLELLFAFISFREEVVTRRSLFDLRKARERSHILEGLLRALENIDEVIAIIKASPSPSEARVTLVKRFGFSEVQAQAILDMRLQRLTALERGKIEKEYSDLEQEIVRLKRILSDKQELKKVIKKELQTIKASYNDPRRTDLVQGPVRDLDERDLIPNEKMVVTITRRGYVKRTELTSYRTQKRGGVGLKGGLTLADDFIEHIFVALNHSSILYFTNTGRVYQTKVYEIPERERRNKGIPVANIRPMQKEERICAVLVVPEDLDEDAYVLMATRRGFIKKVNIMAFRKVLRSGIIACSLDHGDEVIAARIVREDAHIIVATRHGKAAIFSQEAVREMGRQAKGVRAIRFEGDDHVVAMDVIVSMDDYVINLTENGYGKMTPVRQYPVHNRGGKGVYTVKITDKTGYLVGIRVVKEKDEIIIISNTGKIIRLKTSQARITGRSAQGVRMIRLAPEEKIIDFTRYIGEDVA